MWFSACSCMGMGKKLMSVVLSASYCALITKGTHECHANDSPKRSDKGLKGARKGGGVGSGHVDLTNYSTIDTYCAIMKKASKGYPQGRRTQKRPRQEKHIAPWSVLTGKWKPFSRMFDIESSQRTVRSQNEVTKNTREAFCVKGKTSPFFTHENTNSRAKEREGGSKRKKTQNTFSHVRTRKLVFFCFPLYGERRKGWYRETHWDTITETRYHGCRLPLHGWLLPLSFQLRKAWGRAPTTLFEANRSFVRVKTISEHERSNGALKCTTRNVKKQTIFNMALSGNRTGATVSVGLHRDHLMPKHVKLEFHGMFKTI